MVTARYSYVGYAPDSKKQTVSELLILSLSDFVHKRGYIPHTILLNDSKEHHVQLGQLTIPVIITPQVQCVGLVTGINRVPVVCEHTRTPL